MIPGLQLAGVKRLGCATTQPSTGNWLDDEDFGLLASQDNAYGRVEARRAWGAVDRKRVGGFFCDYGDFVTPFSAFLRGLK